MIAFEPLPAALALLRLNTAHLENTVVHAMDPDRELVSESPSTYMIATPRRE